MTDHPNTSSAAISIVQQDIARIKLRQRRATQGWQLVILLIVDLAIVSSISFGVQNWSIAHRFRNGGRTLSFTSKTANFYETPDGVRIVSKLGHDRAALEKQHATFPPPDWNAVATAFPFPVHFQASGHGLLTPWYQSIDYKLLVCTPDGTTVLTDPKWRAMYCDWLATDSDWAAWSGTRTFAAALRKGDHNRWRISVPLVLHDLGFVVGGVWSISMILAGAATRTSRSARRVVSGECPVCGYDLLFNFSCGCPECGWGKEH